MATVEKEAISTSTGNAAPTDSQEGQQSHPRPPFLLLALLREKLEPDASIPPPPDGSLQAWTQVVMAHLVLLNTWGFINSFGFFQAHYVESLNVTPLQISWVASVQVFLLSFIGSFSGRLMDGGHYRYCLIIGFALQILGIFMTSLATRYWHVVLAQGICCGVGDGLLFCPTTALVATYFVRKRSLALSIVLSGSSTSSLIFPLIVQQLLPRVGHAWAVRSIGFVTIACFFICLALARTRILARKSGPRLELSAFKEPPYALFVIGIFLSLWAVYFVYFYMNLYAIDVIGVSQSRALTMLYIINAMGIPGRILPAIFADRLFGILNTYVLLGIIAGLLLCCWIAVKTYGGLITFLILYGLVGGGVQGTALSSLPTLTKDLSKMGTRSGMCLTIVAFACLTGPPIAGALVSRDNGRYEYAFTWGGTSLILGSVFVIAARRSLGRVG